MKLRTDHTGNALLDRVRRQGARHHRRLGASRCSPTATAPIVTLALDPSRVEADPEQRLGADPAQDAVRRAVRVADHPGAAGPPIKSGDRSSPGSLRRSRWRRRRCIGDLLPLLKAVKPAELNATLTAVADALHGRGDRTRPDDGQLGHLPEALNADASPGKTYTTQLINDLTKLGKVSAELNADVPDIVSTLNNLQTNARTLINQQAAFDTLLSTANSTSNVLDQLPGRQRAAADHGRGHQPEIYGLLDAYTPEYTCMLDGVHPAARAGGERASRQRDPAAAPRCTSRRRTSARTSRGRSRCSSPVSGRTASACRTRRCRSRCRPTSAASTTARR